ncbi:hypothetical protein WMW72_29405, partial [Paenibacillus filicis]
MNIGGIIRGLVGDAQIQEPKTLELKVGQVVKGVVQQQLPNQEALVNIGGVQVRAQLETPLKQGEMTMLQVQPESANGQIVLKPLQASQVQIPDTSMGEVLKTLGMSDTPENRQLVQLLHQNGVAITKESVKAFTDLQAALGKSMPQAEWMPTAVLAFQKGLPLTPETVLSLRQTVQGPPFHQVLDQLAEVLSRAQQGGKELTPQTRVLLDTVKTLLAQVREAGGQLTQAGTSGASGAPAPQAGAGVASGASAPQAGAGVASGAPAPQAGAGVASGASAPQAGAGVASGASAPQAGVVGAGGASAPQAGVVGAGGASAPQAGVVGAGGASAPQAGVVGAGGAPAPQAGSGVASGAPATQA